MIPTVSDFTYLGIVIDSNLKWEKHVTTTINKAMRILGLLKSTLWHADVKTRLIAYTTLCRSLLEYASDAWDPHLAKDIYALEMVQNRAVHFISSLKEVVSVSGEREQLSLQTPEERRTNSRLNTLMKVLDYEHLHSVLIDYFNNLNTCADFCQTRNSTKGAPKAQTISKDQF